MFQNANMALAEVEVKLGFLLYFSNVLLRLEGIKSPNSLFEF